MNSRRRVPIQGYLAALLALVTLATGISTAALFYSRMKTASLREASLTFDRISTNIAQQVLQLRLEVQNRLSLMTDLRLASAKTFAARLGAKDDLWPILDASDLVRSAYAGFPNGDFIFLRRALPVDEVPLSLGARVVYVLRTIERNGAKMHARFFYYDRERRLIGVRDPASYRFDPRTRPWWNAGRTEVIVTPPYIQNLTHSVIYTIALQSSGGSVLAADVSLDAISALQARLLPTSSAIAAAARANDGMVFGLSNGRKLQAANAARKTPARISDLGIPVLAYAFSAAQGRQFMEASGTYRDSDGRTWLYAVEPGKSAEGNVLEYPVRRNGTTEYMPRAVIVLAAPEDEVIADALRVRNDALFICIGLILAMIPIGYWLARFVSSPLSKLRRDALAIRHLDFSERPTKDSFIAEIGEFDETFDAMRAHIREHNDAVSNFVPREFLEQLGRDDITGLKLGDHHDSVMTILFSDIRMFTTLSGTMTPDETFRFVNSYLTQVGPIVREQGGFIDKYIGDAIFALFPRDAKDAVDAAIAMQRKVVVYNEGRTRAGYRPIAIGVGIHRGDLMLGTIGEERRYETTVISDAVNIASRMEGLTKTFGALILTTADVVTKIDERGYRLRNLGPVQVKGALHPVTVYEVCDADPAPLRERKMQRKGEFDEARLAYTLGDFVEAYRTFAGLAADGSDRAAAYFRDRSEAMIDSTDAVWDGVEKMETK